MIWVSIVIYVTIFNITLIDCGKVKFEVVLENVTKCIGPEPPYPMKPMFVSAFTIRRNKGAVILSGSHKVLIEVPFYNFSVSTYRMGTRQPKLLVLVDKLNCRSIFGKMFLLIGGFRYSSKDCRVEKGTYRYSDVDFNKLLHSVPNWHDKGRYMHRASLVYNDTTVFCNDLFVLVHEIQ